MTSPQNIWTTFLIRLSRPSHLVTGYGTVFHPQMYESETFLQSHGHRP